jgi:hypothetical protein
MRYITEEESLNILRPLVENEDFVKFSSHMSYPHRGMGDSVYRFTINIMSLDLLIGIMETEQVQNVYFTAAAPGPGQGMDGISMNYKVYVRYHMIQD